MLRGLGAAAATVALGGSLAGCAATPNSATGERPLKMWHLFSGGDGLELTSMIDGVEKRYPDLSVETTCLDWGTPYYTKLAMAAAGGRPPDLAVLHLSRLAGFGPSGLLHPYDEGMLAGFGVSAATSTPALWNRCKTANGTLYAIPLDTHPFVAFYNLDIAERAGLLGTDGRMTPITSIEQFFDAGRRLARVSGGPGIAFGFINDSAQAWRLFWGLYAQAKGEYRFELGSRAEWDETKAAEVIGFVRNAMDGTVMLPNLDYHGGITTFTGHRAGMILSGEWELPNLAETIPRLGASPMPTLFGTPAIYADSHSLVIPRRTTFDGEDLRRTYQLATGLLQEGLQWAKGGHIPGFAPITATPAYQALMPQAEYAAAAQSVVLDPPLWYAGAGSDFQNDMCTQLIKGFVGTLTPQQTQRAMLDIITDLNRTQLPFVPDPS